MSKAIAIVGMACEYPDAHDPAQLWENVLAQRRAFRRIPAERLCVDDYYSRDKTAPDATYSTEAAVLEGYEFDRLAFRIVGSTYEVTDPAHWLALDVASRALTDAGFPSGDGLPRENVGVFVGNTLTGDFSRASVMRLRWPYVRRIVAPALSANGIRGQEQETMLDELEASYKAPFPPINEESLAGSLSNTIAGRICGHFDFKGGGYSLDGACASSLLAVANACEALLAGRIDVAIAGGVDLSIDPFELIGFAKAGALATGDMKVFDKRSAGFWPGEGCGFVVLMRESDLLAQKRTAYALVRGWGISSDGKGGITRPEHDGQLLALQRAYARAGYDIASVGYFEAHGTGTQVGDATELEALSTARHQATAPAALGSIKANIGHTKAAAGVAGLIKATLAIHHLTLPPTTGCTDPHPLLARSSALRILREALPWPDAGPARAGVSALGFGGINAHIALEAATTPARTQPARSRGELPLSGQDCELFLFAADDSETLTNRLTHILSFADKLSRSELIDLATHLQRELVPGRMRCAVVAATAGELSTGLASLVSTLRNGGEAFADFKTGTFLDGGSAQSRVGFVFPGQGTVPDETGGLLARRFESARELYSSANLTGYGEVLSAEYVQPALTLASLAGLKILSELGVEAQLVLGHSLGELSALHWAGCIDEATTLQLSKSRGSAMDTCCGSQGAMAAIEAAPTQVQRLLADTDVVVAACNGGRQTVVSGDESEISKVVQRAHAAGLRAALLEVTHAFHSSKMADAAPTYAQSLAGAQVRPAASRVISTVTGRPLDPHTDLRQHLVHQLTSPVLFTDALAAASNEVELFIEVGAGRMLAGLVADNCKVPVISLDVGSESLRGLLLVSGWASARGIPLKHELLFRGRFARPFNLEWNPRFLQSPCEKVPLARVPHTRNGAQPKTLPRESQGETKDDEPVPPGTEYEALRTLVARRAAFPIELIADTTRLLKDLNLNSMLVAELVVRGARLLGRQPPLDASSYAKASFGELAGVLLARPRISPTAAVPSDHQMPAGLRDWTRAFRVELIDTPASEVLLPPQTSDWHIIAPLDYPSLSALTEVLATVPRPGVAVVIPDDSESHLALLLDAARRVAVAPPGTCLLLLQGQAASGASFARSLHLEAQALTTCVITAPLDDSRCAEWVRREAIAASGFIEAVYTRDGIRKEPRLALLPMTNPPAELPLGEGDVLLVTGGGKGITAECALALGQQTGARLALVGRSDPNSDKELKTNLDRFAAAGCHYRYYASDLVVPGQVSKLVHSIELELGPITGVIHGAGTNNPISSAELTVEAFQRTLASKVTSLGNVLAALPADRLKLLVGFSSIIGRVGFERNADYAVANERLTALTEAQAILHPRCRCLALEWSAWSGVGMAERVGLSVLQARGVTPIPVADGVAAFLKLLTQPRLPTAVVVTGRFGQPETIKLGSTALGLKQRFLERVWTVPGVELIADARLSFASDPYLKDHVFNGQPLFPGVMGLEAMAQAARAVTGLEGSPTFEDVRFNRALPVSDAESVVIRLIAQVGDDGSVDIALRCRDTGFAVDHFSARCRFNSKDSGKSGMPDMTNVTLGFDGYIDLSPETELYGPLLFHTGRFRRIVGYRRLSSRECMVMIKGDAGSQWFASDCATPMLGDAAVRDAALHAIQACIPHATILPIGIDRLDIGVLPSSEDLVVHARERTRDGDKFTYDLVITNSSREVVETWDGLQLQAVAEIRHTNPWPEPLLGPYFERRLDTMGLAPVSGVAVGVGSTDLAISRAAGEEVIVTRDAAGRPSIGASGSVSAAHAGVVSLGVTGRGPLGCDLEPVISRTREVWSELLGASSIQTAELLSSHHAESFDRSATRVWAARECLIKAGLPTTLPMTDRSATKDGWMLLAANRILIATWVGRVRAEPDLDMVFAFLAESPQVSPRNGNGSTPDRGRKVEEYHHTVGFEETNLVGNVYFAHYLRWQEAARDRWLRRHDPSALTQLHRGEWRVREARCEYQRELFSGDEVTIRTEVRRGDDGLSFEFSYHRADELIARGVQVIGLSLTEAPLLSEATGRPAYDHRHTVTFEETQSAGGVHHVNYFRWQGSCREMFLHDLAPDVIKALADSLCLVTKDTQCQVFGDLSAGEDVIVRMRLDETGEFSIVMNFEYWHLHDGDEELVATGMQTVLVMERNGDGKVPCPIPPSLKRALEEYSSRDGRTSFPDPLGAAMIHAKPR